MKTLLTVVSATLFFTAQAFAGANCQHSHSWQCQGHHSNSGGQSQSGAGISSTGKTPDPATNNPHLGTVPVTQPMAVLTPATIIKPAVQQKVPTLPAVVAPPKPAPAKAPPQLNNNQVPPLIVTPIKSPSFTGLSPVVQVNIIQIPPLNGQGKVPPIIVTATQAPGFTGISAVPNKPVIKVPSLVVTPIQSPSFTGISAVPNKPVIKVPSKKIIKVPPMQVYLIPQQVTTGMGAVPTLKPQIVNVPPKVPGLAPSMVPVLAPSLVPSLAPLLVPSITRVPQPTVAKVPAKINSTGTSLPPHAIPQPIVVGGRPQAPNPSMGKPATTNGMGKGLGLSPQIASTATTHLLVNNQSRYSRALMSTGGAARTGEVVEPGIQNKTVELYRSNDATEQVYGDIIPMDKTGFFLTVVGIKEPHFSEHRASNIPVADDDYIFFFDYASSHIYEDQRTQYDAIVARYQKRGERVVVMGETDGFGSQDYNTHLAINRSNQIIDELVARGVKVEDIELKVWVRCCRVDAPTRVSLAATEDERVTWVQFQ